MAMAITTKHQINHQQHTSSPAHTFVAKPPPPPLGPASFHHHNHKTTTTFPPPPEYDEERRALDGIVAALRLAAAAAAFVGVALVASCRHGDWMEFARYPEYRYLLGASVVGCVFSAAQATRSFRRIRRRGGGGGRLLLDFAGDQVVAYLLITAASAALPITMRMRSAVVNIFTDAMVSAIGLALVAFAALALSAMLNGFRIAAAARPY
ncbi:hypothetical protein HU200_003739 [Digitaria exilis]|uniref:CASP-like protein n=1 Tax=Digitaria exilis TaxID=1010633 RepID=A0A835CDF3_9POAL|nr:hypothetical protein HU200_022826 [Digitaria exilis]KAF8776229.1 hypothetical protein HU200_003739 [Digitaria exilis]